ncbi:MAG TPA: CopD family protein [Planctomycetota bacterium]|nr:CopD family protein [Planctomycetota bacterium]
MLAEIGAGYNWLKWVHVLGVVIYVGGLMALTRLLGYAVRFESEGARTDAYRIFKRMHKFANWAGLGLMLAGGLALLVWDPAGKHYLRQPYFHVKLTAIVVLFVGDVLFTRKLFRLEGPGPQPGATSFRILHGVVGLALLAALAAIFIVRG